MSGLTPWSFQSAMDAAVKRFAAMMPDCTCGLTHSELVDFFGSGYADPALGKHIGCCECGGYLHVGSDWQWCAECHAYSGADADGVIYRGIRSK